MHSRSIATRRVARALPGPVLLAAVVALLAAAPVLHTELESSSPEEGAVLEAPVEEILLTFTTSVQGPLSRIAVTGPDGAEVAAGDVEHPEGRQDQIRVALARPTEPGTYEVDWQTVAPDGHVVRGAFAFSVQGPEEDLTQEPPTPPVQPEAPGQEPEDPLEDERIEETLEPAPATDTPSLPGPPAGTGTRWIQLLGTILLLGVVGFRYQVLPALGRKDTLAEARTRLRAGLSRFGWIAVFLLLVAAPLRLRNQLAELGEGVGWNEASFLLLQTAWGGGWFLHLGVVALGIVGLVVAAPKGLGDRGWAILAGAALFLPFVPALQGHAWGAEGLRAFTVPALYLHVAAVGLWLGGLIMLVLVGLPAVRGTGSGAMLEESKPPLFRLVNAFSRMALPAVVLFIATGVVNTWFIVGGVPQLIGSTYGLTLLLKLGIVAGALALGFYNWRRIRPALAENPDAGALRIPASIEAMLGIIVLLVTAALVTMPPP